MTGKREYRIVSGRDYRDERQLEDALGQLASIGFKIIYSEARRSEVYLWTVYTLEKES
jgi:hypothetical protein